MRLDELCCRGDETGRVWITHITPTIPFPGRGERRVDVDREVLLHTLPKKATYNKDIERARAAVAIARLPEVRASPVVRQLIDTSEDHLGLTLIWEWVDTTLLDLICDGRAAEVDPVPG